MRTGIVLGEPRDYGIPYDDGWRPGQDKAAVKVINMPSNSLLFLQAPTGLGKSGIAAVTSKIRRITALVASRDLQVQYATSFPWFDVVWGMEHYTCALPSRIRLFMDQYGEPPSAADCSYSDVGRTRCPSYELCPYEMAKHTALISTARILNYAYGYWSTWWRANCGDVFCDEAHRLPLLLSSLTSLEVAGKTRANHSLPDFPVTAGASRANYKLVVSWCERARKRLMGFTALSQHMGHGERMARYLSNLESKLEMISDLLKKANEGDWYIQSHSGRLSARPINPSRMAYRLMPSEADRTILMSATLNPQVLCTELGIDGNYDFLSLPHVFPEKNRPVIWAKDAPSLNVKSGALDYTKQADLMDRILTHHGGQRGIIHTTSWSHSEDIMKRMSARGHGDRMMLARGHRLEKIDEFRNSAPDTVVVSPSWGEGLDLADDACRFGIIAKIPFPSLADPVVRMKLESNGGRNWYDWMAATGVVQRCGRNVRHRDDWATNYILDSNWSRVSRQAPDWFTVQEV